jgi:hypothetical protein
VSRTRRPPANERAGSNDSSPDPSELDEEKRDILRGLLRQAGVEPTKKAVERLIAAIESDMAAFRQAASQSTRRERHDALRALLRLADEDDPPVAVIRKRIAELERTDIAEAEERAHRLWSRVFPGESLESGFDFAAWLQTAEKEKLLEAVRTFFTDGGAVVQGRARPSGKRSKPHLEPLILGQVRGAAPVQSATKSSTDCMESLPSPPGSGRPRSDAEDNLVMHLAVTWDRIPGLALQPGRSDRTPFGALVHHVFGWLDLETAEQSLRRYWDDVRSAEIVDIEGGQVFR